MTTILIYLRFQESCTEQTGLAEFHQTLLWFTMASKPAAGFAVDGDKSPMYWMGSCSHTEEDRPKAWWIVDLEGEYLVTEVVITNRGDCCGKSIGFINAYCYEFVCF